MFTFDHPKFKLDPIFYHKIPSILKIKAFFFDIKSVFTRTNKNTHCKTKTFVAPITI